jgi:rfaE bifunctional protein kinase chain/domain
MHPDSVSALEEIRQLSVGKKRVVFVSGNFNVVHPGHLRLLKFAAECGDMLVVGVLADPQADALLKEDQRLEGIKSISIVTYGFILRDPPEEFITELRPAFVIKGREHEGGSNPEKAAVEKSGGKLLFGSGDISFSSMDLLRREFSDRNIPVIVKPSDFPLRHGFSLNDLQNLLHRFQNLRVTVIGDLIVDEYINCDPLGMSQEDPTVVVTPIKTDRFIGGAAIVAAHARGFGAKVRLFSVSGNDEAREFAVQKLLQYDVNNTLFIDESRPTTLKQRYRAGGKTLLRVSHLRQHALNSDLANSIYESIKQVIKETDVLIFSDFNYGCLPQSLVEKIAKICTKEKVLMVADSQSSSQIGDVSRYHGMAVLTPTEREARLAMRDFESGLVVLAEKLRVKADAKNVIITLGEEGMLIHAPAGDNHVWHTDRLPSMNAAPKDTAGAGDSLLCCSSMALAVGANIWQSAYLGSIAAACQVSRVGNTPLSTKDISSELAR